MIANLDTFAGALARNSDRLDGIVSGLERMTGGAAAKARASVYDLSVPPAASGGAGMLDTQLVVPDPTALSALDNESIHVTLVGGASATLADAQWADTLTKLLQTKIIRSFEDSNLFVGVSRPLEGLTGDFQLLIDIRKFQMTGSPLSMAEVLPRASSEAPHRPRPQAPGPRQLPSTKPSRRQEANWSRGAGDTIRDQYQGAAAPKANVPKKTTKG
jgi:phospholipid/cholesterol/gamma-HCH transport system substrate-binding protein